MTAHLPIKPFSITAALDFPKDNKVGGTCVQRHSSEDIIADIDDVNRKAALAKRASGCSHDDPVRVEVTVFFMKIGEIDTLKESYEADVMVKARWREPALDKCSSNLTDPIRWDRYWNPKLYVENVIGEPKETAFQMVTYTQTGQAYVVEKRRIKGTFMENLELDDFPFDIQDLTVTLMSDRPASEVELSENPDDIHRVNRQSFIDEQEWILYKCVETELMEISYEHEDPSIKRSALKVKCRAARRPAYFFWNIFLITFLICSLSFVTFSVSYLLPQNRLQLTFTLVLTSVAFKFVVNQSLPKISYLTYLDVYILVTMVMLTLVCVWHAITTLLVYHSITSIETYDLFALCAAAGAYILFNAIFIFRIYMKPGSARKRMEAKEKQYAERVKAQLAKQPGTNNGIINHAVYDMTDRV